MTTPNTQRKPIDRVALEDACPACGEREPDELVWRDGDSVECQRCNMVYRPGFVRYDIDAEDLLSTLTITKVHRRAGGGGAWVKGTIGGHRFDALVFSEHATNPDFELNDSRISKLWVRRIEDRATVVHFDRGWDTKPATPVAEQIVELLTAGLADVVWDQPVE
jgi:hypothetical protein